MQAKVDGFAVKGEAQADDVVVATRGSQPALASNQLSTTSKLLQWALVNASVLGQCLQVARVPGGAL